jgi:hypothetical protein
MKRGFQKVSACMIGAVSSGEHDHGCRVQPDANRPCDAGRFAFARSGTA